MHVSDLNGKKSIGSSGFSRCKVESYDFKFIVIAYLRYILEKSLAFFRYDLDVRKVLSVFAWAVPEDIDESSAVFLSQVLYVDAVRSVDSDTFALGNISDDRISRYRIAAGRAPDEKIVCSLDDDA